MSSLLKLTLATGETQEIPFHPASSIAVKTGDVERAYTDVTKVELVQVDADPAYPAAASDEGALSSPGVAILHAKGLSVADAGAHVERALLKFPDDADLQQVYADIGDAVRAGAETWSTDVEVDVDALSAEPAPEPAPDAWLELIDSVNSHADANDLADELGVAGFGEKEPNLDEKRAALRAAVTGA